MKTWNDELMIHKWLIYYNFSFLFFDNVEDGKLMADADTGEFWGLFGGFAPLPRKTAIDETKSLDVLSTKLYR